MSLHNSYRYCWKLAKRTGKNFYYSFLTLPREKHLSMCAIYAWMRLLDDSVDDAPGAEEARAALDQWEAKTRAVLSGNDSGEAGTLWPAFLDTVQRYNIPDQYFFEIIRGAEMDLTVKTYQNFDDLYQYCYRVASVVGLACLHVLGFTHPQAKKHGEWLGIAFQLTNILRDIKEDAERGRIYLPLNSLKSFKINPKEILELQWSEELHDLIESFSNRAEIYYQKAQPLFGMVLPEARPTLEIMAEIYGGILKRLREIDFDVFNHRAGLTLAEKLMAVARRRFRLAPLLPSEEPVAPDLSPRRVAIVGGGAAGLAAAVALSEFGYDISLFEKKAKLGGKAAWFSDPRQQKDLENPLQLWLNIHANTGKFFSMIGVRRFFERQSSWCVLAKKDLKMFRPSGKLPFPFNWLPALKRLKLNWRESWSVVTALIRLVNYDEDEREHIDRITFQDWLRFHDQKEDAIEKFWRPFLRIGIPDQINRLSTRQAALFFRRVSTASPLQWYSPSGPTSDIYNEYCKSFLNARHVKIRAHETVSEIIYVDDHWEVVSGEAIHRFDDVVLTMPPDVMRQVLHAKDYAVLSARTQFERLGYAPAILARLEFRQPLFEDPYTILSETPFSWGIASQVPRMSSVMRAPFAVTFAGHDSRPFPFTQNHELLKNRVQDIWENVLGQGQLPVDSEFWCDVDRDFASEPGSHGHRPGQETPLPGLWLAGDWTQTEWPAGLEGSLESGFRCAEKILQKRGWKISFGSEPVSPPPAPEAEEPPIVSGI